MDTAAVLDSGTDCCRSAAGARNAPGFSAERDSKRRSADDPRRATVSLGHQRI